MAADENDERGDEQEPEVEPAVEQAEEPEAEPEPEHDEEADEEADEEPEPEPEPEPAAQGPQPPQTPEAIEARMASWDRERDRHMRELQKRDDYRYDNADVCPICQGHGLVDRPRDENDAAMMRNAILALVGDTTPEELNEHPDYRRCETCDGQGKVRTGSRVAGQEALNCPTCNGQGHSGGRSNVQPLTPPAPAAAAPAQPPPEEQQRIGNDAWGRPPGHPHYGLLPATVG